MNEIYLQAALGGLLIGLSATLMLLFSGRIAGISGILFGLLERPRNDMAWRIVFLVGLLAGGFLTYQCLPADATVVPREGFPMPLLFFAGLLVGFGTRIGSGCTSGHGVCGIGRLSTRSIVATMAFMGSGIITVYIARHLLEVI